MFGSPQTRLEYRVNRSAPKVEKQFHRVVTQLKQAETLVQQRQKAERDIQQFLDENADTRVDQNVGRSTDELRARKILLGALFFESLLSYKGTSFLADNLVGITSWMAVLPMALLFAMFSIYTSIYLNNFAQAYSGGKRPLKFAFVMAASYSLIWIIPICNLLEGYASKYSSPIMVLNYVLVAITLVFHCTLITLSEVIVRAENSNRALQKLRRKEEAIRKADAALRRASQKFLGVEHGFARVSMEFVQEWTKLQALHPESAKQAMLGLRNFTIFAINSRVYQNTMLAFHTNAEGLIVTGGPYINALENGYLELWQRLTELNEGAVRPPQDILTGGATGKPMDQGQITGAKTQSDDETAETGSSPEVGEKGEANGQIDEVLGGFNPNPNDKTL